MIVGDAGGGKSSAIALALGVRNGLLPSQGGGRVRCCKCFPKALTQAELYGAFALQSREWTDGLIGLTFRRAIRSTILSNPQAASQRRSDSVAVVEMSEAA